MLDSLVINGFKKYSKLELNSLGNINFIVGNNNMGKSTVLEAIFAWACGLNGEALASHLMAPNLLPMDSCVWAERLGSLANGQDRKDFSVSFIGKCDKKEIAFQHRIKISGVLLGTENIDRDFEIKRTSNETLISAARRITVAQWNIIDQDNSSNNFEITIPWTVSSMRQPNKLAFYRNMLSHQDFGEVNKVYSQLKKKGAFVEFLSRFKKVFPEIEDVESIPYPNGGFGPVSVKLKDGKYLPLYNFGDGCQMWFYVIGSVVISKDAILCMDEVDATLHPSIYYDFCYNLIENAGISNSQIFFTTHNLEFIDQALKAYKEYTGRNKDYSMSIITLEDIDGKVKVRSMDGHKAYHMRCDFGMELR